MSTSYTEATAPESVGESLSRAWVAIKANIWLFAGFTLLFTIAYLVVGMIPLLNFGAYLFSFVYPAGIYTAVEAADGGREIQFSDFFSWTPKLSRLLVGMLIQIGIFLAIFIPLLLMFIFLGFTIQPAEFGNGMFTSIGFMMLGLVTLLVFLVFGIFTFSMTYLLLKKDISIGEVIKLSWKFGWRNVGSIILFFFLFIGLYLLGCIALLVGLLVTFPLMMGSQYFYLRSRFPDEKRDQWDFDQTTPPSSYQAF